jgi:tetratricopeptide (TPR) repeat protein
VTRHPVRRSSSLLRLASALALAFTLPAAGCGGKAPPVEEPEEEDTGPSAQQLAAQARAAAQAGDIDDALAKFSASLEKRQDPAVRAEMIDMLIAAARLESAVELSRAHYDANPTDATAIHLYAHALLAKGDFAGALAVAEELLALDDNDAAAHDKHGRAMVGLGQVAEGVEELRRAVSIDPRNVGFLVELGTALLQARNANEAALQLRAAVSIEPENPRALLMLGVALRDQDEKEEAEVFLRKATKAGGGARAWFELGVVQNKRKDQLGAEQSLAQAVQLEPGNGLYQYAYAETLRINKKLEEAIAAYRASYESASPHPKASAKLGVALAESGRAGEAEVHLTEVIRKDPANAFNYFQLAVVLRDQKKTKLAIEMYEQFLQRAEADAPERDAAEKCVKALKRGKKC